MEQSFAQLQAAMIASNLGVLEAERKAFVKKFLKQVLICTGVLIGVIVLFTVSGSTGFSRLLVGGIIFFAASSFLIISYNKFYKNFKAQFKGKVIPTVVKYVDERLDYDPTRSLINEYTESRIFNQRYDRHKAEDTISGTFDSTSFSFGEIHTEYKTVSTDKNGNRQESWHTIFKGMFFVSDFHKNFEGETIIDADSMERFFGKFGRNFQKWNPSRAGKLVQMENPEFEKRFAVYSTDEQECRYILSLSMMERLVEMSKKINFQISLSFRNNQVYLAVFNNMDLFEPSVFGSLLKEEDYKIIISMLRLMTGVIEDLNLNTRIWTKE